MRSKTILKILHPYLRLFTIMKSMLSRSLSSIKSNKTLTFQAMFVTVKEFDELKKKLEEVETRMKGFEEALAKMKDSDTQNIRRVQLVTNCIQWKKYADDLEEPVSLLSPAHSSFARHCDSGSTHTSESEILSVIPSRRHVDVS